MVDSAALIWDDFNVTGVPGSGAKKPPKNKIREWGTDVEAKLSLATTTKMASVLDYIAVSKHAGIKAKSNTDNLTTEIQAAIDANPGGLVFPPGLYNFTEVTIASDDGVFVGHGAFLKKTVKTSNGLKVEGDYNTFYGFNIDGIRNTARNLNEGAANILCSGSYNKFFCISSYNGGQGINFGNVTLGASIGNVLAYSRIFNQSNVGVSQYQHYQGRVESNLVFNCGLEAITCDVFSHRSRVLDNEIYNVCEWGGVGAIGWDGCDDVFVERNYISGCPLIGIAVAAHSGHSLNGRIVGNRGTGITGDFIQLQYFTGPDLGWGVGPYYPQNTFIEGNQCDSTIGGNGITNQSGVTGTRIGPNMLSGKIISDPGGKAIKYEPARALSNIVTVAAASTLTESAFGALVIINGGTGYTTTLPSMTGANERRSIQFWNNGSATMTLSTPAGGFFGPSGSGGGATMTIAAGLSREMFHDGTNWIVLR